MIIINKIKIVLNVENIRNVFAGKMIKYHYPYVSKYIYRTQDLAKVASFSDSKPQKQHYAKINGLEKVQLSFFDKRNDSTSKDEQAIAYAELQKALFFCQRKKIPLLFVSLKGMIDDIRFLNLLEESHVDFRCIDFPWFCKENLPLIKAVVLYEKLEIRINV